MANPNEIFKKYGIKPTSIKEIDGKVYYKIDGQVPQGSGFKAVDDHTASRLGALEDIGAVRNERTITGNAIVDTLHNNSFIQGASKMWNEYGATGSRILSNVTPDSWGMKEHQKDFTRNAKMAQANTDNQWAGLAGEIVGDPINLAPLGIFSKAGKAETASINAMGGLAKQTRMHGGVLNTLAVKSPRIAKSVALGSAIGAGSVMARNYGDETRTLSEKTNEIIFGAIGGGLLNGILSPFTKASSLMEAPSFAGSGADVAGGIGANPDAFGLSQGFGQQQQPTQQGFAGVRTEQAGVQRGNGYQPNFIQVPQNPPVPYTGQQQPFYPPVAQGAQQPDVIDVPYYPNTPYPQVDPKHRFEFPNGAPAQQAVGSAPNFQIIGEQGKLPERPSVYSHPRFNELLDMRENVSAKDSNSPQNLLNGRQVNHVNNGQGYENKVVPATYERNYNHGFELTKQDVANIKAGKITPEIEAKIAKDLERLDNDPMYAPDNQLRDGEEIIPEENNPFSDNYNGRAGLGRSPVINNIASSGAGALSGSVIDYNQDGKNNYEDAMIGAGLGFSGHIAGTAMSRRGDKLTPSAEYPQGMRGGMFAGERAKNFSKAKQDGKVFEGKYDGMDRFEIDDSVAKMIPLDETKTSYKLNEVIDHPELFDNYPHLKDVSVSKGTSSYYAPNLNHIKIGNTNSADNNLIAQYSNLEEAIYKKYEDMSSGGVLSRELEDQAQAEIDALYSELRGKLTNKKEFDKKTLLHEVQHAIQNYEGFARGGNIDEMLMHLDNKIYSLEQEGFLDDYLAKQYEEQIDNLRNNRTQEAFRLYQNLAGEIESRIVEARANMTAEQRATTDPYLDTVSESDAMVRYGKQDNYSIHSYQDWKKKNDIKERMLESDSQLEELYNMFKDKKFSFPTSLSKSSPIRKNQEYGGTMDLDTECTKTVGCNRIKAQLSFALNRELTASEQIEMIKTLAKNQEEYPCPYCYVEDKRAVYDKHIANFKNWLFDKAHDKTHAMKSKRNIEFKQLIKERGITEETLDTSILSDAYRMQKVIEEGGENSDIYSWLHTKAQGASRANKMKPYSEYRGELMALSDEDVERFNKAGGFRMHSSTDYKPEHAFDIAQFMIDAQRKGLKLVAYTKQPSFVDAFGATGAKINMSIDMLGGLTKDGKPSPILEGDTGFNWESAKAYREKYPNAGTIAVALNDEQLKWALDQDWIDYVIPHHGNIKLSHDTMVKDYSTVQNPKDIKGFKRDGSMKLSSGKSKVDWKMTTHEMSKEKFLQIMNENKVHPQFSEFIDHPNYMKMIAEYARYDSPQNPIDASKINFKVLQEQMQDVVEGKTGLPNEKITQYANETLKTITDPNFEATSMKELPAYVREQKKIGKEALRANEETIADSAPVSKDSASGIGYDLSNSGNTQVATTIGTYTKAKDEYFKGINPSDILDYGAGMGKASEAHGFDSLEPYAKGWSPTYTDKSQVQKKYKGIINNAVLNVLPKAERDAVVLDIADKLDVGGKAFINVRGQDVFNAKGYKQISDTEIITSKGTYQKAFSQPELIDYLKNTIGDGYTVEKAKSGIGTISAVITKNADSAPMSKGAFNPNVKSMRGFAGQGVLQNIAGAGGGALSGSVVDYNQDGKNDYQDALIGGGIGAGLTAFRGAKNYDHLKNLVDKEGQKAWGDATSYFRANFTNTLSRNYMDAREKSIIADTQAGEKLARLHHALTQLSDEDNENLHKYIVGETSKAPQHLEGLANSIKNEVDTLSRQLVDDGILTQEAYDEWAGAYLHRIYDKHFMKDVKAMIGKGFKIDEIKERGKLDEMSQSAFDKKVQSGEIDSALLSKPLKDGGVRVTTLPNGKIQVKRDWTPEERKAMGEITKASITVPETLMRLHQMKNHSEMLKSIEGVDGAVMSIEDAKKFTVDQLGESGYTTLPKSAKYGVLAGRTVRYDVANDIKGIHDSMFREIDGISNTTAKAWLSYLSLWKKARTVWNAPSHVNNFMSNAFLMHLSGMNSGQIAVNLGKAGMALKDGAKIEDIYRKSLIGMASKEELQTLKDMSETMKLYEEAKQAGMFGRSMLNDILRGKQEGQRTSMLGKIDKFTEDAYQAEDHINRLAMYIHMRTKGKMSNVDAVRAVNSIMPDYTAPMPRGIRMFRDSGISPFISWTYYTVPNMFKLMKTKQGAVQMTKALATIGGLSYLATGIDPLENVSVLPDGLEFWRDGEVPDDFAGRRIPVAKNGDKIDTVKVDRYIPYLELMTSPLNFGASQISGVSSNALVNAVTAPSGMRDIYNGRLVTRDSKSGGQQAYDHAKHAITTYGVLPQTAVTGANIIESMVRDSNNRKNDDVTNPRTTPQELMKLIGLNTMTYNKSNAVKEHNK